MFMQPRCVMSLAELQALPAALPLHSTEDGWEELGRRVTERQDAMTICGLTYFPKWATAPFSALN